MQNDPARLKSYFLKGYSLVVAITFPATIACAVFADDIVLVMLGPQWTGASTIFRLLAPTILVFGMINPTAWLLQSIGLQERSLKIALVLSPLVVCSYLVGSALWPERRRSCLLHDDGFVARATPRLVPARHGDYGS